MLIAAEWPIYGRYGYAPATLTANFELDPRRAMPLLAADAGAGAQHRRRRAVHPRAGDLRRAPGATGRGTSTGAAAWWARRLGQDGWRVTESNPNWIVHEGPDGPDGLLGWHPTRDFDLTGPLAHIEVDDFVTGSDDAYARPVELPVRHRRGGAGDAARADGRRTDPVASARRAGAGPDAHRRLPLAAAARRAGRAVGAGATRQPAGSSSTSSTTPPAGTATGRFLLDTDGVEVACTSTAESADLRLDQRVARVDLPRRSPAARPGRDGTRRGDHAGRARPGRRHVRHRARAGDPDLVLRSRRRRGVVHRRCDLVQ